MLLYTVYLYLETALLFFEWYSHPSSGAHTIVSKASGICHTVTATCRYRGVGTGLSVRFKFNVHGSVHRKYIPVYIQQDTSLHILFISRNCSTCFGWYLHSSSETHTTVSTASGIWHTVTAHIQTNSNHSTIAAGSSNAVSNTRCCRYSCLRSWWWVEVPPEICRAVSRYK
jgi:hypothetical protein